jgi:hypothetical protein
MNRMQIRNLPRHQRIFENYIFMKTKGYGALFQPSQDSGEPTPAVPYPVLEGMVGGDGLEPPTSCV